MAKRIGAETGQVTVSVANLRTGPGTDYGYVLSNDDSRYQVSRGTILDVVGEEDGWYEVRLNGTDQTAFIKQELCGGGDGDKRKRRPEVQVVEGKEGVTLYKDVLPEKPADETAC